MGQVYVPRVNWALMVATVLIVIGLPLVERDGPPRTASP
jgi:K+ transporter